MRLWLGRFGVLFALVALLPASARAQNTSFGTAVHLLVGQAPVRVTLTSGATATRYYDAQVVANRSYCAEATASETEANPADPTLTLYHADQSTVFGTDSGATTEPKAGINARVCFVSSATETMYIQLTPASATFENREYTLRFVETTLWTNWFFTGGDYSSFTLLRNTTNLAVVANLRWKAASGADVGTPVLSLSIPANGVVIYDARSIMSCPAPAACAASSGSVEVAHSGSPEAIVGSQTTLSGSTGLSFDTLFFQRRAW